MIVRHKIRPRKTVADFMALPEGTLAELIDGELFMSPAPKTAHQAAVGNLFALLHAHVRATSLGQVFVAPYDVHLPSGDIVEPDILFVQRSNLGIVQDWVRGVPDLVIEVLSPDGIARDRFVKHALYARNGVREYWIVDPEAKSLEIFSLSGKQYEPHGYFEADDIIESLLLQQFKVQISELFTR